MQWYTSENGFCSSRRRNDSAQSNNFARSIAVSILRTHYPSGRTWANISYFVWVMRLQYKDGHETHYASRRATFLFRRSRRISKKSSSRHIMRLVPVFILETHNQTNYKCLPKFIQSDNASSSIKTANVCFLTIKTKTSKTAPLLFCQHLNYKTSSDRQV